MLLDPRSSGEPEVAAGRGRVLRTLLWVITLVLVVAALRATAIVTLPLALAIFLVILLWPVQRFLERSVPAPLAAVGTLAVLGAVVAVGAGVLVTSVNAIAERGVFYEDEIRREVVTALAWLDARGLALERPDLLLGERLANGAPKVIQTIANSAAQMGLVAALFVLALLEVRRWRDRIGSPIDDRLGPELLDTFREISRRYRRYVLTRTFTSLLTGLFTGLFTWAVGIEFAVAWGLMAFVLNYIPTIGSVLAVAAPTVIAMLQFDPWVGAAVGVALISIQLFFGNYVDPLMQGRHLRLSPMVVLFSVAFWAWVWGILGALIGVPLTVGFVIACQHFEDTRWLAHLLADEEVPDRRLVPRAVPQIHPES